MKILAYTGLIAATILTSYGQIFYKKASIKKNQNFYKTLTDYNFIVGSLIFIICPVISYFVLKVLDFSVFYAFTALNYIFIIILSGKHLNENIDSIKITGVILIITGLIVYNY